MSNETYIITNDNGLHQLANGNAVSEEKWEDYEDAKEALKADKNLQAEADKNKDPDLYNDSCAINWIA